MKLFMDHFIVHKLLQSQNSARYFFKEENSSVEEVCIKTSRKFSYRFPFSYSLLQILVNSVKANKKTEIVITHASNVHAPLLLDELSVT